MGAAGAGSLAQVINTAIGNRDRMANLKGFFEGVGANDTSGVWEGSPNLRPDFRAQHQKKLDKALKRNLEGQAKAIATPAKLAEPEVSEATLTANNED